MEIAIHSERGGGTSEMPMVFSVCQAMQLEKNALIGRKSWIKCSELAERWIEYSHCTINDTSRTKLSQLISARTFWIRINLLKLDIYYGKCHFQMSVPIL